MSARVLVVDDIEVNVRLLEAKLLSEYYDVLTASDGHAALELARSKKPDIVLLDVMMPGMDGLEVCRQLKADLSTRHIPVVMITALSDVADRLRGLEVGADDFLTKPVNDVALFARVRSLIRLKRTLDEWMLREEISGRLAELPREAHPIGLEACDPARILVLEDNPLAGSKLKAILKPLASELSLVDSNAEVLRLASLGASELIVISMAVERDDPLRLVSQLRAIEQTRQIPVLLIMDEGDHARLAKGLDLGANDYIVRPVDSNELIARARIQLKRKRLHDDLLDTYKRGLALALTDDLTGLYNRRYLMVHLETLMQRSGGPAKEIALLLFDIDRFKEVNDTYGHAIGDEVLAEIARRSMSNLRGFDLVARYGGDEMVVILPESAPATVAVIAERLRAAISRQPIAISRHPGALPMTISVGVAITGPEVSTPAELLKRADEALYAAKRSGRNAVMMWDTLTP